MKIFSTTSSHGTLIYLGWFFVGFKKTHFHLFFFSFFHREIFFVEPNQLSAPDEIYSFVSVLVGFSVPSKPPAKKVQNIEREKFFSYRQCSVRQIRNSTTYYMSGEQERGKNQYFNQWMHFFREAFLAPLDFYDWWVYQPVESKITVFVNSTLN